MRGHNWTAYRPGTQFGYGELRHGSLKMHACVMRAHERATPMRYRHLRCTFCEIYAPIRCRPLRYMPAKETSPEMHAHEMHAHEMQAPMSCAHPVRCTTLICTACEIDAP